VLYAKPKGLFSNSFAITDAGGASVAELAVSFIKEGGQLHHDGQVYRLERESLFSGPWRMLDKGKVLYEARKPSLIRNRFMVTVRKADLELSPVNLWMRGFKLVGSDWEDLGSIRRPSLLSRRALIDLDDRVPVEAQLFLFFLANVLWRRADSSTAGAS